MDGEHRTLHAHREQGVGDDHRNLDDAVRLRLEAGHLQVDPHEVLLALREHGGRGLRGCLYVGHGHSLRGSDCRATRTLTAMSALDLTLLFCALLIATLTVKLWLASRQIRHVAQHRAEVPAAFRETITLASHQRAADYTIARLRFGLVETAAATALLLGWTLLGGLDALNLALRDAIQ